MLDGDIILSGSNIDTRPLVDVGSGGKLVLKEGSKITNNWSATEGGGVYVAAGGTFTMNGTAAKISKNSSGFGSKNPGNKEGGGVGVGAQGKFYMTGQTAVITGNRASALSETDDDGSLTIFGGLGGGVLVMEGGTFVMSNGEISGNNGESGGGVGVGFEGIFKKETGGNAVIYGSDETGQKKKNFALTGSAAYVVSTHKKGDNTAGAAVELDSSKTDGGWEN